MTDSFAGRTALVTGAGRGIGRAIAVGLGRAGATVALLARSEHELAETAALVEESGARSLVVPADLRDDGQLAHAVTRIRDEWGGVDILVNNAAVVWPLAPSVRVDVTEWAAAMKINVIAAVTLTFAFLPGMVERGWGRIVNVSTGGVADPGAMIGGNAYIASKSALEGHTINLGLELDGSGVTANVYRPGPVDTAIQTWIRDQDPAEIGTALHRRFVRTHADGKLLTPEHSAGSLLARLTADDRSAQIWDVFGPA
ncbi:SDR family NAD(P)-dependent oxidoreductase [Micromonospora sp. NPDC049366]|uniref:SDR family NAD(P)-dependent oxidoreductase n=1 Tax=Micromonospora sp. NPDC049366 TaxID=3364271 RepID=UPI0037ABE0D4